MVKSGATQVREVGFVVEETVMAWHLRKKPMGLKKIPKIPTIKPIKPIQPIKPIRPIKPIAPIGHEYYWRD
jgi:hypothetical protein